MTRSLSSSSGPQRQHSHHRSDNKKLGPSDCPHSTDEPGVELEPLVLGLDTKPSTRVGLHLNRAGCEPLATLGHVDIRDDVNAPISLGASHLEAVSQKGAHQEVPTD